MANYITDVKRSDNGEATEVTAQWESVQIQIGRQGNSLITLSTTNIYADRLVDKNQLRVPKPIYSQIFRQARAILIPRPKKTPSPKKPSPPKQLNLFDK